VTSRVGIVVPTLGKRLGFLSESLNSIRGASEEDSTFVVLVAPSGFNSDPYIENELVQKFVDDPGAGLASAINAGFAAMPEEVEYINWLGDDDLLSVGSLDQTTSYLDKNPKSVMVYGGCDYVDPTGKVVWKNKSSRLAVPILRFGPDLVPQPGALFRASIFAAIGGLDPKYSWAFDFDLFIRFSKVGRIGYINRTLASFRWHPGSLSVAHRRNSVNEASRVRVSHLPKLLKPISFIWESLVRWATFIAGNKLTSVTARKDSSN
jgi:GT2 family glycosyltransferase